MITITLSEVISYRQDSMAVHVVPCNLYNNLYSDLWTLATLFSVYTNEVQSRHPNIKLFKYADDMAIDSKPDDIHIKP